MENIDVKRLNPHPYNPRKNLGEMAELADSIKANGVLQNLTVVPEDATWWNDLRDDAKHNYTGGFTVVIGHRRLAAAKMAGLTELPCAISDMPIQEQVATMLLENMQRAALTTLEQADGFQMMIDFGGTVGTIAEQTGFAETTVRHRLKLKELDRAKLEESDMRGGRIEDYIALERIKDAKDRNKLLEHIGTPSFKWNLENAIDEQERPERKKALIAELERFAMPIEGKDANGMHYVAGFWGFKGTVEKPADAGDVKYFYTVDNNSISLYKKASQAVPAGKSEKEKAFDERLTRMRELTKRAYELRYEFVKNFSAAKKHAAEIQRMAFRVILAGASYNDNRGALDLLGIGKPEGNNWDDEVQKLTGELLTRQYDEQPEKAMLAIIYANCDDKPSNSYFSSQSWNLSIKFRENESLDMLYDGLISLGYQISEEEQALRDGTHELFDETEAKE